MGNPPRTPRILAALNGTLKGTITRANVPILSGLELIHRGKVRDTYDLGSDLRLIVATDGISVFDFVLNALVPGKGAILTAMTHFWFKRLENELGVGTHLVAAGSGIDAYLPESLLGNIDLQSRAMVVERFDMDNKEYIYRSHLTGSGLKEYQKTGQLAGVTLRPSLQDGDRLPITIFDPTDKAEEGHDERIDAEQVSTERPEETELGFKIYQFAVAVAEKHGVIIADTKFEFGRNTHGELKIGDEALTPDSSRFWSLVDWRNGRALEKRKTPSPFDKQLVRDEAIKQGINKLDPKNLDDVAKAHAWRVPQDLIEKTTQMYRYIFWRLTGRRLEEYQREEMGIDVADRERKVAVVFGSESDIPHVRDALEGAPVSVHVISCHRNPVELQTFAMNRARGADVVVAAGGKAFALPGVLDAFLHDAEHDIPVIGVALGDEGSISLHAARLSISELPGNPVVMDEEQGLVYAGMSGFTAALTRAMYGEFPVTARTEKLALFDIDLVAYA